MLVDEQALFCPQRFVVLGGYSCGELRMEQFGSRFADDAVAREPELGFGHRIDQHVAAISRILHRDLCRDVVDDLAQERMVAVALLLEIAALGDVFDRGDPAAMRQGLVDDRERASVAAFHDAAVDLALRDITHDRIAK